MHIKKIILAANLILFSCGGGSTSSETNSKILGNVSGLDGTLILQLNNSDKFTIQKDGDVDFKTTLPVESNYTIRVIEEPCPQRCSIENTTGKVPSDGIIHLKVSCDAKKWELPVSVSESVSFPGTSTEESSIAMNDYGDVLLAWTQIDDAGKNRVYKREFINRTWINPIDQTDFVSQTDNNAYGISTATNITGISYISWTEKNVVNESGLNQLYIAQKLNDIWVFPSLNDPFSAENSSVYQYPFLTHPLVKINNSGDGFAAWSQNVSSVYRLYVSELKNGLWSNPISLNDNFSYVNFNQFDFDLNEKGDVAVSWNVSIGYDEFIVVARRLNGIWIDKGTRVSPSDPLDAEVDQSSIAMDGQGNITVAWNQWMPEFEESMVFKADYKVGIGWVKPKDNHAYLGTYEDQGSGAPSVTMNNNGQSILTWREDSKTAANHISKINGSKGIWNSEIEKIDMGGDAKNSIAKVDDQNNGVLFWTDGAANSSIKYLFKAQSSDVANNKWDYPVSLSDHISLGSSNVKNFVVDMKSCRIAAAWTQLDSSEKYYQLFVAMYR